MGRPLRMVPGDYVYHVLNRANGRAALFETDGDVAAFGKMKKGHHMEHRRRFKTW